MDEFTMRSRVRRVVLQLETTIKRLQQDVENGTYSSALSEARIAKPQLIDLTVLLELLSDGQP